MKKYLLVITAGGIGKRFGKPYPKQLETIMNQPILNKTASFFEKIPPIHCIITYPEGYLKEFEKALNNISYPIAFVKGGNERFDSVKNAINKLTKDNFDKELPVLVHDGVRPFLNLETVEKIIQATKLNNAAVPYISVSGTMRKMKKNKFFETIDRENSVIITTPQGCKLELLNNCFLKADKQFTDESTLLQYFDINQTPVADWSFNIKITEKNDLKTTKFLWNIL